MPLSRPRSVRIGIKLLLGMTQPPAVPPIDLGWGVFADFTTSLVEAGEQQEKWQLLRGIISSTAWWMYYVYCLWFRNLVFSIMTV